jgi:hypothetical protein
MHFQSAHARRQSLINIFLPLLPLILMAFCLSAQGQVPLTQISSDPFTNSDSQHATEVEASTLANGNTMTAFQQGRYDNFGGSSGIGFATSTDGGLTWTNGTLPGLSALTGGTAQRISDPAVAYDAKHDVWMIATLPVFYNATSSKPMLLSRSTDGGLT